VIGQLDKKLEVVPTTQEQAIQEHARLGPGPVLLIICNSPMFDLEFAVSFADDAYISKINIIIGGNKQMVKGFVCSG
jgi:hypothetical protein